MQHQSESSILTSRLTFVPRLFLFFFVSSFSENRKKLDVCVWTITGVFSTPSQLHRLPPIPTIPKRYDGVMNTDFRNHRIFRKRLSVSSFSLLFNVKFYRFFKFWVFEKFNFFSNKFIGPHQRSSYFNPSPNSESKYVNQSRISLSSEHGLLHTRLISQVHYFLSTQVIGT